MVVSKLDVPRRLCSGTGRLVKMELIVWRRFLPDITETKPSHSPREGPHGIAFSPVD